ncbi:hypothetical protein [Paenibacillus sp. N3.4]|uniref:hypothetical protein n=1 Tax=Paenibacillus sp. N3.4 TaxID=2603222 RepID=UPI0011C73295|nr:hypothetical protein [Paenibacillus sp. N3.4]TXK85025.1 hypothetical protein FU659_05855 [Paenibacillus sp. N3.4]
MSDIVAIENTNAYKNIVSDTKSTAGPYSNYDDVIQLKKAFEDAYTNHFQMIDSMYLTLSNGKEFDLHKDIVTRKVGIHLPEWMERYSGKERNYFWLNSYADHVFESSQPREVMSVYKVIGVRNLL